MKNLKGTKTEQNLRKAFAGECQATVSYQYFSSKAKKEGYEQIAEIFNETSGNEKEHAKLWFKYLHGGDVPATMENLLAAAGGEHDEWTDMYKQMAKEARAEGFEEIAVKFEAVGKIEKEHEARYKLLAENVKAGKVFVKASETTWKCRNCGHIHKGKAAPELCAVCRHPKSFFEVRGTNYK